ncbi:MAG: HisA/HisF-related TIM barrel protein [Alphaproteobacteria bacterium]|nr:HisA/HisF-related TIM barrel protein [Alphaproteobacteria bacterium]
MIKKRIIPTLTYKDYGLVKSKLFNSYRMIGDPVQAVKVYNLRDVDELLFVDISEKINRPNISLIKEILQHAYMPVTVGGGVNTLKNISDLLDAGADKVCLSTKSFESYDFVEKAVHTFGAQAIVISVDYIINNNEYFLVFNPDYKLTKTDIFEYVLNLSSIGVSELILTSVERDGMMSGYDIEFIQKIEGLTSLGIITNGGAGTYQNMLEVFESTNAVGVAASSIFLFTEQTPKGASRYLKKHNINVRN